MKEKREEGISKGSRNGRKIKMREACTGGCIMELRRVIYQFIWNEGGQCCTDK